MGRSIIFVLIVVLFVGLVSLVGLAASGFEVAQIEALLEAGFDVDVRDDEGRTALMVAVSSHQNRDVVVYLLEAGADPNARNYSGVTPLMYAAFNNDNPEILSILLSEANLDINAYDHSGWTALMHASRNNVPEVLSALLQVGPELEIRNNSGLTALMLAAGFNENPEMITLLTEAGAQVDAQSEPDGWSALMMSSLRNNPNVISTLLDVGADISLKSSTGRVAYDYVLENPNIITTDVLSRLSTNSSANDGNWLWGAIKGILALFLTVSFGYVIIGSIFSQGVLAFSYGIPMSRHLRSLDIIDNETVLVRRYFLTIILYFSALIIFYVLTGYFLGSSFIIMMTIGFLSSLSVYSLEDPEHMWSFVSLNSSSFKNPQLPDILVSKYFSDLLWMNRSKKSPPLIL